MLELIYIGLHVYLAGFAIFNSFFWRDLHTDRRGAACCAPTTRISLLVPARNEARNLERLIPSLLNQDAANLEIIVLNDRSEDDTQAVLEHFQDSRLRVIEGAELPEGWLGKNWACHQLSRAATGDVLIFTDADTLWQPFTASDIAYRLESERADALCAWAAQRVEDNISRVIQPLQQWSLIAFLPLFFVPVRFFTVAVAANGQCLAFTRAAYQRIGGHEAVKNSVIEDMALARAVKQSRGKFLLLNGAKSLETRMYSNEAEAFEGYAKNVYPAFGATPTAFFLASGFNVLMYFVPWLLLPFNLPVALIGILCSLVVRVISDVRNRYDLFWTLLHPIGIAVWAWIGLESMRRYRAGRVRWKGREYDLRR
jgi:glycosyltransferase involved in cell wall biosynthesis